METFETLLASRYPERSVEYHTAMAFLATVLIRSDRLDNDTRGVIESGAWLFAKLLNVPANELLQETLDFTALALQRAKQRGH